ncbi:MAG: glycerophosphodiester phosphodiesterase [Anaerolineales bacterium]|nr:glycerophosphodiester phosphodiesterase [Anaerolineales bacterium]
MFDLRQRKNGRPLLVGHRGAMAVAPENTLPALEAGLAGGADILEIDVQLSADGQVVLFHDADLEAKTGLRGFVSAHSTPVLRGLDVGSYFDAAFAGTQMPLLGEALAWAKGRVALMIELKACPGAPPAPELTLAVIDLIEAHGMVDETILISFDQFALQAAKRRNPHIATSFIYTSRYLNPVRQVEGLAVDGLSPGTNYLSQSEVRQIHAAGYACSPGGFWWDYAQLLAWGVDSISSNDPASVDWDTLLGKENLATDFHGFSRI